MFTTKKIASNTFYIFLNSISTIVLSFLYFVIAGKLLTPSEYGITNSIIQFSFLITTFSNLGLNTTALKLVSEYYETKKMKKLYACIGYCFKVLLLTNIFVSIFIFFLSPYLARYIFRDQNSVSAFVVSSMIVFSYSLTYYFGSIIYGLGKVKIYFLTEFLVNLLKLILAIVLIIYFKLSFLGPLIGYLIGLIFSSVIRFKEIEFKYNGQVDKKIIWGYALPALINASSSAILTATPPIILSSFSSTTEAGIFSLVSALSSLILLVPTVLYTASFPIFSGMYGKKDHKGIEKLLNLVLRYILLLSLPISFIFIFYPEFIIKLVASPSYLPGSKALSIFGLVSLILGAGNLLLNVLYALGKPKLTRNIMITTLTIYLIFAIPLSIFYGAFGMALTYLLATSVLFVLSSLFVKKFYEIKFNLREFLKIISSSLFWSILVAIGNFINNSIYFFIIFNILGAFCYFFLLLIFKTFNVNDFKILNEFEKIFPTKLRFVFKFFKKIMKIGFSLSKKR
ncbi:MAG: oligosaccharide flippase family protein [Candidatus Aenigmatarchaeota archaeon]